jgi:DNA-directed RNA polymerase subunit K/omega
MNTNFVLLARYESPFVALKEISQEFLGITPITAEQKAKSFDLPFPTIKLRDSERSPTMVKVEDLAKFIDDRYEIGLREWQLTKNNNNLERG